MRVMLSIGCIILLGGFGFTIPPSACNSESLKSTCISKLGNGFNFLKSYSIDSDGGAKEKVEYSYVFTRGTQYQINLCSVEETKSAVIMNLLDGNRNKVATNKIDKQLLSVISFSCNATGIYYIQYTFEKGASCAGSALGFSRPEKQ